MGKTLDAFSGECFAWYRRGRVWHAWEPRQHAYGALHRRHSVKAVQRHQRRVKSILDVVEAVEAWRGSCAEKYERRKDRKVSNQSM